MSMWTRMLKSNRRCGVTTFARTNGSRVCHYARHIVILCFPFVKTKSTWRGDSPIWHMQGVLPRLKCYDPLLDIWTPLADMAIRWYKCVGVTWQGKFYVVGGFAGPMDASPGAFGWERSSAEVYDKQARKWGLVVGMWQLDVPPNQIVEVDGKLFSCGDCLNAWKVHIEVYDGSIWNEVEGSPQAL